MEIHFTAEFWVILSIFFAVLTEVAIAFYLYQTWHYRNTPPGRHRTTYKNGDNHAPLA